MLRRMLRRSTLLICLVLSGAVTACDRGSDTPATPPPSVTVERPTTQAVTNYLDFTGNTAASNSVTLTARVEGFLEKISFSDGQRVRKDDLLFTIQQAQYEAQLKQAEAQVAAQKAALEHAKTELARYTGLVAEESAPQTEVDRWKYERDSAAAGVMSAEAQVALAKLNLSYTLITAPFDGRMGRHLVDVGNLVGAMGQQTSLAQIDQVSPLYVYFTVDERDVLRIMEHRKDAPSGGIASRSIPVEFGMLDEQDYPHQGTLDFASLGVAPTTGTLQVRGIFPNPEPGVLPGLFVRVRVPMGEMQGALLIPGDAIGFDQQGEYVLIVNDADMVERSPVKTGATVGEKLVVREGLDANNWVVTAGLSRAIPGRKVAPKRADGGAGRPASAPKPLESGKP